MMIIKMKRARRKKTHFKSRRSVQRECVCVSVQFSLENSMWLRIGAGFYLLVRGKALLLLRLLGEKHCLNVGQDATLCNGDAREELVELLVVADGQLEMAGDDAGLLVVAGGVTGELEHLGSQILHDGSEVDRGSGTDALGVVALPQETVNPADGKLQSSTTGTGLGLALNLSALAASRHGASVGGACGVEREMFLPAAGARLFTSGPGSEVARVERLGQ